MDVDPNGSKLCISHPHTMSASSPELRSNYNAFGRDPAGRLAHIAAHFYGPAWQPKSFAHLKRLEGRELAPPRYGYPAPEQRLHLPANFVPHLPPSYYGAPRPPYLPGPATFDPKVFAALLVSRVPARKCGPVKLLNNLPIGEVAYNGEYWVLWNKILP